jgi:DNA-binding transcriptional MerR regulator
MEVWNVEEDLISKKDLLQVTGISYGQLYRWKRKGLIPEDWFIRKSSFTGQETFFPRERILARVARIQSMKSEDLSLDDIATELSPDLAQVSMTAQDVLARGFASRAAVELYAERRKDGTPFVLGELLTLRVLDALFAQGAITAEEGRALIETMETGLGGQPGGEFEALLVRKAGLSLWMLVRRGDLPRLEPAARVVVRIDLAKRLEELKSAL